MLMFLTSIVFDLSLGIAWWVANQMIQHTVTYIFISKPMPLMLTK